MPFVAKADTLITITVNPSDVPVDASPERLAKHLARKGLPTRIVSLRSERGNLQPSILSIAADEGLDLLVMGG
jgi:nucleotide-binding universal stress UspA family protein